jgi:transposase InsO family protein
VESASATAAADGDGPGLLDRGVEPLEELAEFLAGGAARDRGAVAPPGLQALLGMEESTPMGSARDWEGPAGSDPADESRESALGCAEDPRRAVEARPDCLAGDGVEVHGRPSEAAVAGVANILEEPRPGSIALDFFTVPTATFRVLFGLVVLTHSRRRLVHFNVTEHPTAEWTARQLHEACALEEGPRYLIRDRDQVYGERFSHQARTLDMQEAVIAHRSPWQNAYAERVIGSIRREWLDHVVVIGARHLREILSKYVDYYNGTRTHLSLSKDAPKPRPSQGRVVKVRRVGGLHHEYRRRAA